MLQLSEVCLRNVFLVHASIKGDLQKEGAIPHVGGSGENSGSALLEFPCKERWMYGTTVHRNQQWPQTAEVRFREDSECGGSLIAFWII